MRDGEGRVGRDCYLGLVGFFRGFWGVMRGCRERGGDRFD